MKNSKIELKKGDKIRSIVSMQLNEITINIYI